MRGTDMLLAEGMNIRVLLLPDGDDPDSFARKHSTEELRKYIDEHQTDFITFKSRLTVENVSDPIKRSEAIGGIVKSISVVPDQILRSTYLADFAHRIGMKEQTLILEMNKYIRKDIEDKEKEREREAARSATAPVGPTDAPAETPAAVKDSFVMPSTVASGAFVNIETLLMREVIRHGEEVIYNDIETDDGQKVSLTVAQYIDFDLSQDGILFSVPLYNQILAEAVSHCDEPDFKAEAYFCSHPDVQVSQLATRLAIDRHQLGGRFVMQPREDSLRQRVLHLVMDYRLNIVEARLKDIQQQLRQAGSDMAHVVQLMQEYKDTQELRDMLAKKLGSDLVAK
jgi:DNA primase